MKTQELLTKHPPRNFDEMVADMLKCEQTQGQSVYQHGKSVNSHFFELTHALKHDDVEALNRWRIPKWLLEYKDCIESTSFKSKWKKVDRRGKQICKRLFGGAA